MEVLPASNYNLLCESLECVLANEEGEPGIEDQRDSFFLGKAKKDAADPVNGWRDHQPPSAWRQSHDEIHLEANLAKSGSQHI